MATPAEEKSPSALDYFPERISLTSLRDASRGCRGCHLWRVGTQTVFGEGLKRSRLVMVGEVPGDKEDLAGRPFVGPAGRLLDEALVEAGIDRDEVYVTNVVKHFKWIPRGKRRIHQKPNAREIRACLPWLEAELRVVKPEALVLLGATAAQSLLGPEFRVTTGRGTWARSPLARWVTATVHPSSILRAPGSEERRAEKARFIEDLRIVSEVLSGGDGAGR